MFGFDPSSILPEIERELATDCRLAAELLDILVYTPGSKFLPHKDTPRHDDQLGTLIVELPHAHRGGEMTLVDGERVATVDWSRAVSSDPRDLQLLRWVALFGDVDHEIAPITSGTRITAVFTLRYRSDDRLPAPHRDRIDVLVDAAIALHDTDDHPTFAIPCSRMIVVPRDPEARYPLSPGVLRGADRLIAAALERASIAVSVRECIVLADDEEVPFVDTVEAAPDGEAILLNRPLPRDLLESANALSWHPDPVSSYDHTIAALEPYEDGDVPPYVWLVREHVRPPGESMSYSATGYFGNEYSERYVYRFAMIIATAVTA